MTNLYVPKTFTTPYDTPEQRRAARYGRRRRHRHAARISESTLHDLQFIVAAFVFWAVILGTIIIFG